MYQTIRYEKNGNIGIATINRPEALNALNSTVISELEQLISEVEKDAELGAFIITGEGRSFVAGADIGEQSTMDVAAGRKWGQRGSALFRRIEKLEIPTIAAVNGFALGGGCELAMSCDIILAAGPNAEGKGGAKFGQPEVGLGITPGFSGTQRLPRRVGVAKAKELIFSGKQIGAEEAKRIGLVNEVYAAEELLNKAVEMAKSFTANAPIAVKYSKACIDRGMQMDIDNGIALENELFAMCFATEDQKDAMAAFLKKVLTAEEAALLVNDGDTIATGGFVSCACPEALSKALEKRFLETGHPRDLTLFFAAGQGHRDGTGGDHYGHEGMVKRVIGGHWDRAPKLGDLALSNKIEAYNLPQGVISHMYRDIAAHNIGTITHVGLYTFADPRNGGGKLNDVTKEDLVKVVEIEGQERLLYKAFPINVVFLRASYADEYGNCTVHREIGPIDVTAMAQACKNSGGRVIVQVEKIVQGGSLDPKLVAIPGIYVDSIVVGSIEDNEQCLGMPYDGSLTGEFRIPVDAIPPIPLDAKKIIARRAAMELPQDAIVNLGTGAPEKIANVAAEEGISDKMTLTVEAGSIAGVPMGGTQFGAAANSMAIIPHNVQFDFYQGGGLDVAFLGLAETAPNGDLNVSKFGTRLAGAGGFIDITQNAKKVVYCGTFTAKGLKTACEDGKLVIVQEGAKKKFVNQVEHITFSGKYAVQVKQPVLYITERAVFELRPEGVTLIEIAPGIDLQTQVLDQMEFMPKIAEDLKLMDERIFKDELMGLAEA